MEASPFQVSVTWGDGEPTVHIRGDIDFATAPALNDALAQVLNRGAANLALDFRNVSFLDSEGLKVLLQTYSHLTDRGGSLTVKGCDKYVAKTFEILGLDHCFDCGGRP